MKKWLLSSRMTINNLLCVLLKNYRLLCCFHLGRRSPSLIKIAPSQLTEVNAFFPQTGRKRRRLVYTKSIFTLQDQSPALLPWPRSFLFKQQSPRWCSEPISPGQHGLFHLGSIGWCKLPPGFSIHNFMVLEVTAENADFFFSKV